MNFANTKRAGWKSKVIHEMVEYYIIFITWPFSSVYLHGIAD